MGRSTNVYIQCSYCNKLTTKQVLSRHLATCSHNPEVINRLTRSVVTCELCGEEVSERDSYSKRFCTQSCARSYSTKGIKGKTKEVSCSTCDRLISIPKRASQKKAKCLVCKAKPKARPYKTYLCSYCDKRIVAQTRGAMATHERSCPSNSGRITYRESTIRSGYIYLTTNLVTGKIYIGKKKGSPEASLQYFGSGIILKRALKKYGKENFSKTILEIIEDGDLNVRERFWIKSYSSTDRTIGYNLTEGGDGGALFKGRKHSETTKLKLKQIRKEQILSSRT